MVVERTLSILKPDSVKKNLIGAINSIFEKNDLKVVAQKMIWITNYHARIIYMEHEEKPFFEGLVKYMTSGPVVVQVLEGENAIRKNRQLMGKTNPAEADEGTIRRLFGESIEVNSVHGSDSVISVEREIRFFFSMTEVF
jgi:nucleoside-diphosphate kinase